MDKLILNETYINETNDMKYKLVRIAHDHVELMYIRPEGGGHYMSMGINAFKMEFKPSPKALLRAKLGSGTTN